MNARKIRRRAYRLQNRVKVFPCYDMETRHPWGFFRYWSRTRIQTPMWHGGAAAFVGNRRTW